MTEDDKIKKAAEELAKEAGGNPPEPAPEGTDVSMPQNEAEVQKYKPEPDKDGEIHTNHVGAEVKVEDGKATPTEETVKRAEALQATGDEVAKEQARDAEAASEGKKELAETSGADSQGETVENPSAKAVTDEDREAKIRRAQEARAARAAAAGGGAPAAEGAAAERPARAPRAEGAGERPARAPRAAKAEDGDAEPPKPKEPSKNQPLLDRIAAIVAESVGPEAVESATINEKGLEIPTLTVKGEQWFKTAETLKTHPETGMNYLRNLSGVDHETHLEVVYHLVSLTTKHEVCVKVKADREAPVVPSVTPLWSTANWNEREVFDLLGVDFPGHPDLRRIMMSDDWVGHPLRKDYEPLDPEV
ncbi:NADH-quinone oxidoreductase subunit C [Paenibacillus sp.]|uniref:NADH-quinone oxidoreductase subunit C n=1 Tax=Paenibacillus sp. TaxID=58172 RepID=UPI0028116B75|nr:NADH-quinone oxidoreductase subunit C [Paenibacillus sp.]